MIEHDYQPLFKAPLEIDEDGSRGILDKLRNNDIRLPNVEIGVVPPRPAQKTDFDNNFHPQHDLYVYHSLQLSCNFETIDRRVHIEEADFVVTLKGQPQDPKVCGLEPYRAVVDNGKINWTLKFGATLKTPDGSEISIAEASRQQEVVAKNVVLEAFGFGLARVKWTLWRHSNHPIPSMQQFKIITETPKNVPSALVFIDITGFVSYETYTRIPVFLSKQKVPTKTRTLTLF